MPGWIQQQPCEYKSKCWTRRNIWNDTRSGWFPAIRVPSLFSLSVLVHLDVHLLRAKPEWAHAWLWLGTIRLPKLRDTFKRKSRPAFLKTSNCSMPNLPIGQIFTHSIHDSMILLIGSSIYFVLLHEFPTRPQRSITLSRPKTSKWAKIIDHLVMIIFSDEIGKPNLHGLAVSRLGQYM